MWRFLKKLEIKLSYDPAISLLGIHTEETKIERDTCTPMFITALFTIARTWKQPTCPSTDEWIKLWYIHTMEYSVQFSLSVVSDSLRPHGLQHTGLPCPSPTPVHHQLLQLAQTHVHRVGDAIQPLSSSVIPFSPSLQSFPISGSFQMS